MFDGPEALRHLRERGLRAADVDVIPGASGGAKWLALAGLDRYLFGTFLRGPRDRPLHCIGSSIGRPHWYSPRAEPGTAIVVPPEAECSSIQAAASYQ